jgi:hypothetical protein
MDNEIAGRVWEKGVFPPTARHHVGGIPAGGIVGRPAGGGGVLVKFGKLQVPETDFAQDSV